MSHRLNLEEMNKLNFNDHSYLLGILWDNDVCTLSAIDIAYIIAEALTQGFRQAADNIIFLIKQTDKRGVKLTEFDFRAICTILVDNDNLLNIAARYDANTITFDFLLTYGNPYIESPEGLCTADYLYHNLPSETAFQKLQLLADSHGLIGVGDGWKQLPNLNLSNKFFAGMVYSHRTPTRANQATFFDHIHKIENFRLLVKKLYESKDVKDIEEIILMELRLSQFFKIANNAMKNSIATDLRVHYELLQSTIMKLVNKQRILYISSKDNFQVALTEENLNPAPLMLINRNEIDNVLIPSTNCDVSPIIWINDEELDFDGEKISNESSGVVPAKIVENEKAELPISNIENVEGVLSLTENKLTYDDFIVMLEKNEAFLDVLLQKMQPSRAQKFIGALKTISLFGFGLSSLISLGGGVVYGALAFLGFIPTRECEGVWVQPNYCEGAVEWTNALSTEQAEKFEDSAIDFGITAATATTFFALTWLIFRKVQKYNQGNIESTVINQLPDIGPHKDWSEFNHPLPQNLNDPFILITFILGVIKAIKNRTLPGPGKCYSLPIAIHALFTPPISKVKSANTESSPLLNPTPLNI